MRGLFFAAIGFALFLMWWSAGMPGIPSQGFSDEEIASAKASIKTEYEKRPSIKVTEVELLRKSPNELTGFARLKVDGTSFEITKACSATREADGSRYLWSCD